MEDLNKYIRKSHIKAVEKFNEELRKWSEYTNGSPDDDVELYEDACTMFTLSNIRVEDGCLKFVYDGCEDSENMLREDDDGTIWEPDGLDSIMDYLKFWRSCLRRAKRYFAMDTDKLDRLQSGEEEDEDDDE